MSGELCPKCGGPSTAVMAWCEDCDPMGCCYNALPPGSVVLTAEQVAQVREMRAVAERKRDECDAGGADLLAVWWSGRVVAIGDVLALLEPKP